MAESIFLAVPVVIFMLLSRWSKRKARLLEAQEAEAAGQESASDGEDPA